MLLCGGDKASQTADIKIAKRLAKERPTEMTRPFDAAEYLDTPEALAEYLSEAFESADSAFIAHAIGTAARARGMTEVARQAGVSRENLYRSLNGETKPEFDTIVRVLSALGVQLSAKAKVA
jgi:probable addiction module antidote protein